MKKKIIIGLILTILWMAVIFAFSSRSSGELDLKNNVIVTTIAHIVNSNFDSLEELKQEEILSNVAFYVSKTAHYIEYAILAFFLFYALAFVKKYGIRYTLIVVIACLYAISDEFHQKFSGGRTPRVQDVMIDTLGALTMVLVIEFILTIYRYNKNRRKS